MNKSLSAAKAGGKQCVFHLNLTWEQTTCIRQPGDCLGLSLGLLGHRCTLGKFLQNLREGQKQRVFHSIKLVALSWVRQEQGSGHFPLQSQQYSEQR